MTIVTYDDSVNVALVLGAGGARGAMLVGVLEVLEKIGMPIDLIVGSSAGAIVGAMYVYYGKASIVKDKLLNLKYSDVVSEIAWPNYLYMLWKMQGLSDGNGFNKMLMHQLPDLSIEELEKKLVLVATDVETFEPVEIFSGNLIQAVLASSSAPPFFAPVSIRGKTLSDGGISSPVPVAIARKFNPKVVIAIDIAQRHSKYSMKNMFQLAYRSMDIAYYHLACMESKMADLVIAPRSDASSTNDDDIIQLYEAGKEEAMKAVQEIKRLLETIGIHI